MIEENTFKKSIIFENILKNKIPLNQWKSFICQELKNQGNNLNLNKKISKIVIYPE